MDDDEFDRSIQEIDAILQRLSLRVRQRINRDIISRRRVAHSCALAQHLCETITTVHRVLRQHNEVFAAIPPIEVADAGDDNQDMVEPEVQSSQRLAQPARRGARQ